MPSDDDDVDVDVDEEDEGDEEESIKCGLACTTIPMVLGASVIAATYNVDEDDFVVFLTVDDEKEELEHVVAKPTIRAF